MCGTSSTHMLAEKIDIYHIYIYSIYYIQIFRCYLHIWIPCSRTDRSLSHDRAQRSRRDLRDVRDRRGAVDEVIPCRLEKMRISPAKIGILRLETSKNGD